MSDRVYRANPVTTERRRTDLRITIIDFLADSGFEAIRRNGGFAEVAFAAELADAILQRELDMLEGKARFLTKDVVAR